MKTYHTRILSKKISDEIFIVFDGYVENIIENSSGLKYTGYTNIRHKKYALEELIYYFGFEFSLNPYYRK